MPTIIVFCHLRWDFVYQRPQHLLTRLAQHYRIVVVEEPVFQEGEPHLRMHSPVVGITIAQPHTPIHATGFHDDQIPILRPLLAKIVPQGEDPVVWFYTPMALPLLQSLHPSVVVYDCMDELAAFRNSPKQLLQREAALLAVADLVFTGGPSLHEAKRHRHPNVHCLPSSVDVGHFAQALERRNSHPAQRDIAGPRLGFYGVIDERLDLDLIAALADAHPQWQIVLVGPIVKIDPQSLPRRANIQPICQQPYAVLPQLLAGWDICLLPFARNEATRFISPTKVLEYMAAELPIVSTAITDIAVPYGDVVAVAQDTDSFIRACEAALCLSAPRLAAMRMRMREIVSATSWHATGDRMHGLIKASQAARTAATAGSDDASAVMAPEPAADMPTPAPHKVNALRTPTAVHACPCIVIGAGPTGLSAAYHFGKDALLLERNPTVGGWCRSIEEAGFTFDYAGHIMFSNDPYVLELYETLLGANLHWQDREAWVYSKQVYTRYPFQGALYGLPPAVITECIVGAIEARFGDLKRSPAARPATTDEPAGCAKVEATARAPGSATGAPAFQCATLKPVEDCCADGVVEVVATRSPRSQASAPQNFEEFIFQVWGRGIAKHFAIPYNRKLWTVPLSEMETSWLGGRVPLPDLEQIIEGALEPVARPMGPNARFGYPLKGGFQSLMSGFLPHIEGKVETGVEVVRLQPKERLVALSDGRRFRYDHLISTIPLPELVRQIGDQAPRDVQEAARALRHISVRCVNIGVARANITDKHWIYYPEETIFHRIFVQGNASPHCNPPGGFGITCEISYSPCKPLPVDGQALIARCIADCVRVGMLRADDTILVANQVDMPYAYVVYDHARAANVALVKAWMAQHDIILAGRYSEWEYYNSDHAFIAGKKAAETVRALACDSEMNQAAE
ncbi:MAG: FAD-dependent oxidoreductase [Herminiimonas sp.]|nr:FAD-dependent oxidoreductase [Herminiimonas sp.]